MRRLMAWIVMAVAVGVMGSPGCAGDESPITRDEHRQIQKDADAAFEHLKDDERRHGKPAESGY